MANKPPRDPATIRRELAEAQQIRDEAQRTVRTLEDELWEATEAVTAERERLATWAKPFAKDWNDPAMDVYDNLPTATGSAADGE